MVNGQHGQKDNDLPNQIDEFGNKFLRVVHKIRKNHLDMKQKKREKRKTVTNSVEQECETPQNGSQTSQSRAVSKPKKELIAQEIAKDFSSNGDQKILRAIGRTAAVNAAILATALTGGAAGAAGILTGGAMTAKRLGDGVQQEDEREVAKSLAVYGSATTASIVGQTVTGALLVGVAGAALPVAGAVAFVVGCASGITAGALSEWGVDHALKRGNDTDDENCHDDEEEEEKVTDDETVDSSEDGCSDKGKKEDVTVIANDSKVEHSSIPNVCITGDSVGQVHARQQDKPKFGSLGTLETQSLESF
ncbi:unnamed protein product [Cylindrotheca closterium]|uniref:Uncharacterized protein n=1 Tax=Cylindrotheca closterium TaxID=2856 RepID=A0AAD2FSV5_9STRA|nr:unnamed protein product [Cylindrotheca closterium]